MAQLFRETYVCICIAVEKMMSGKGQTLSHHSRELLFLLRHPSLSQRDTDTRTHTHNILVGTHVETHAISSLGAHLHTEVLRLDLE